MQTEEPKSCKTHRQKFTSEEDQMLVHLVSIFGTHSWRRIAQQMSRRSTRQCRERYLNYLSPELKNGPWTYAEDQVLLKKVAEYGTCWSKISRFFESRSDINIKNRYALLVSKGKAPEIKKKRYKSKKSVNTATVEHVKQYIDVTNSPASQSSNLIVDQIFPPNLFDSTWDQEVSWL